MPSRHTRSFSSRPRTSEECASSLTPLPRSASISAEQLRPPEQAVPQRDEFAGARTPFRGWQSTKYIPGSWDSSPRCQHDELHLQSLNCIAALWCTAREPLGTQVCLRAPDPRYARIELRRSPLSGERMAALQKHRHTCAACTNRDLRMHPGFTLGLMPWVPFH